jgi:hypothetical protein
MKEGFIDENTYRIIILAPLSDYESDGEKIKEKGRTRAFSSLQKFLVSKNRAIDSKTQAMILNLVKDNGTLICQDLQFQGNNVFYYDIKQGQHNAVLKGHQFDTLTFSAKREGSDLFAVDIIGEIFKYKYLQVFLVRIINTAENDADSVIIIRLSQRTTIAMASTSPSSPSTFPKFIMTRIIDESSMG